MANDCLSHNANLALLCVLFLSSCVSAMDNCRVGSVTIDRHLFRNSMASDIRPTIGWSISPSCGKNPQTSFSVKLADAKGRLLWSSSQIISNRSNSVAYTTWMHGANKSTYQLKYGTEYQLSVAVTLAATQHLPLSTPAVFVTRLSSAQVRVCMQMQTT